MSLIKLTGINRVFQTGEVSFQALKNINLDIKKGEFLAIVGPSGSGKSTLMNILGLLDRASSGQYFLEGKDVSKLNQDSLANLRNKKIGFIFQSYNLLNRTTALDNVALPLVYSGDSSEQRKIRARHALEQVSLADKLFSRPSQLSGGQQQRVAIARALVTNPEMILADEPTGNLDSYTGEGIIELLKKLNLEGKTVLLITHDLNIAKKANRIISLKDGEVLRRGDSKRGAPMSARSDGFERGHRLGLRAGRTPSKKL